MIGEDKRSASEKIERDQASYSAKPPADRENQCPVDQVPQGQESADQNFKGAGGAPSGEDISTLQKQLEEQTIRADDYYSRLVRLQADYENFRRRTRQEKEDLYKYASEQLVVRLLPVLDNFDRALAAEGESLQDFKSGVEMIYQQLQDVLSEEGVTAIPAVGEPFDPAKHEAVLREDSAEYPENTIIEEFRRGYALKDKVIRPSMVKVAKSL